MPKHTLYRCECSDDTCNRIIRRADLTYLHDLRNIMGLHNVTIVVSVKCKSPHSKVFARRVSALLVIEGGDMEGPNVRLTEAQRIILRHLQHDISRVIRLDELERGRFQHVLSLREQMCKFMDTAYQREN